MRTKIILFLFFVVSIFTTSVAQSDIGIEGLKVLIGEWEAINDTNEEIPIEKWKWVYEPVLEGKGIYFKSFVKMKGQQNAEWMSGVEALYGGATNSKEVFGTVIFSEGFAVKFDGTYSDGLFKLKIDGKIGSQILGGEMFVKIISDEEVTWEFTQKIGDSEPQTINPVTFYKIK